MVFIGFVATLVAFVFALLMAFYWLRIVVAFGGWRTFELWKPIMMFAIAGFIGYVAYQYSPVGIYVK